MKSFWAPEQIPSDFFVKIWKVLKSFGKFRKTGLFVTLAETLLSLSLTPTNCCCDWMGAFTACSALGLTGSSPGSSKDQYAVIIVMHCQPLLPSNFPDQRKMRDQNFVSMAKTEDYLSSHEATKHSFPNCPFCYFL
jgi:hypothetical protein